MFAKKFTHPPEKYQACKWAAPDAGPRVREVQSDILWDWVLGQWE